MNKRILIGGALVIVLLALYGSQMFVEGRIYFQKVELLRSRGYEVDGSLQWSEMDAWEEQTLEQFRNRVNIERKEVTSWDEFYMLLKTASSKAEYDGSVYDGVHYSDDAYVIWFSAIQLRGTNKRGSITTYFIIPDQ
jgi:hypothetical protein